VTLYTHARIRKPTFDPRDDIAQDIRNDPTYPSGIDTEAELMAYIATKTNDGGIIEAARDLWREYLCH
jgi:hypothetical protein